MTSSIFIAKELNNIQNSANSIKEFWLNYFDIKPISEELPIKHIDYPFWEDRGQTQIDTTIYRAVVTDIDNSNVIVNIENPFADQSECYVLERTLFDFDVKINDWIEVIIENIPGQSCIKTRKYVKSLYYKNKENQVISNILKNIDEEDDF